MKKIEFEALLKIQGRYLLMCAVTSSLGPQTKHLFAADVVDNRHYVVMDGPSAKTAAAAVQKSIARYYKQNANY